MLVDFTYKRSKAFTAATVSWKGSWSDKRTRSEFEGLAAWLAQRKVRAGRWIFLESSDAKTFVVGIEVLGRVQGEGGVRLRKFPATTVASVTFDPDAISPRVVYHGVTDWLRSQKRDHEIKGVGAYRELYSGNPWKDAKAWASAEVQVIVKK
jgi:hypothetical protein